MQSWIPFTSPESDIFESRFETLLSARWRGGMESQTGAIPLCVSAVKSTCQVQHGSAFADTCDNFSTFNCDKGTPDVARLRGGTAVSESIGFVLKGTNQFTVSTANGKAASDVIIVAASSSALTGTVNGMSFTSLMSFPEGGAVNAISSSLAGLGFCSSPCSSLSFGFVDLHSALTANGSLNVTLNGVPAGTALYAMMVVNGKIKFITPNSEALITENNRAAVPELDTMALMGTGLIGIAGIVRRKFGL